jgi:hypothetical protein
MPFSCRIFLALLLMLVFCGRAQALITGSTGHAPTFDRDWPAGSLELANARSRVGFWEGPPFGGGEFHFLCRGDAADFQETLDLFAKIRAPELRLVIREGSEESFWLKTGNGPATDAHVDWTFIVWTPRSWYSLYNNPNSSAWADDSSNYYRTPVLPPTLAVNVAGPDGKGIDWAKIKVPAGVTVVDERATAAGYKRADGTVLRGDVYDMLTSKPLADAEITVGKLKAQEEYDVVASTRADASGHFELKHVPAGTFRISISAANHVTRVVGYEEFGANTLRQHVVKLASPITAAGTVKDTLGHPLAGVKVRAASTMALDGCGYILPAKQIATTDAQGRFELAGLPEGYFQLFASDDSHQPVDALHVFGPPLNGMPAKRYPDLTVTMTSTGSIKVKVVTADGRPVANVNVSVRPAGMIVGSWGGSAMVRADGTFDFSRVPPGQYFLTVGTPNPSAAPDADPKATRVEVKPGETAEVQLVQ